jgi:hypothetical protein
MRARRRNWPIEDLRRSIDCLPVRTRMAMLEGVRGNDIIVGAYADRNGGVCPMLAAHRCGGRTDFLSFARAWDRFTGAKRRARRATEREVRILISHLEASLLAEDPALDLGGAIVEHREALERRRREVRPGDPFRVPELSRRWGWSWLRPFRSLDDYERALARFETERDAVEREPERV